MDSLDTIQGFDISFSDYSKRIINIKIEDEIIDKLIFPFKKFDITALEYKPFTRFTLAIASVNLVKGLYSRAVISNFLKGNISLSIISSSILILIILLE